MYQGHRIGAVILMAGNGTRFGGDIPKQFLILRDKKVYLHTVAVFQEVGLFDEIVLVCHPDWLSVVTEEVLTSKVVAGAKTRQESSFLGLQGFAQQPDIVVIHDAVRPFVSKEIIIKNVDAAILHGAADTCIPSADTLVHAPCGAFIDSIPKRANYLRGQTPQTFRFRWIWEAHAMAEKEGVVDVSDDCQLVLRNGRPVHIVLGNDRNFKITTDFDFTIAAAFCIN